MFSFGFYNSKDGDRKYNASHFGKIFDGVIQDGVFGTVGNIFSVVPKATPDLSVIINPGKAWLMHTWNILDAKATLTFNSVNAGYKRTDIICIQVNNNYEESGFTGRTNEIVKIEGSPVAISGAQSLPALTQIWNTGNTDRRIWQYPIAYVTIYGSNVDGGTEATTFTANAITANCIESRINVEGETDANKYITWVPLVTGATLNANLEDFLPNYQEMFENMLNYDMGLFNNWFDDLKNTVIIDPSAQAALAQLDEKIDDKILYGEEDVPATLLPGQVYFQVDSEE